MAPIDDKNKNDSDVNNGATPEVISKLIDDLKDRARAENDLPNAPEDIDDIREDEYSNYGHRACTLMEEIDEIESKNLNYYLFHAYDDDDYGYREKYIVENKIVDKEVEDRERRWGVYFNRIHPCWDMFDETVDPYDPAPLKKFITNPRILNFLNTKKGDNILYHCHIATFDGYLLRMKYKKTTEFFAKWRIIEPYKIEREYIIAFCHLRQNWRVFRIDRVRKAEFIYDKNDRKKENPKKFQPNEDDFKLYYEQHFLKNSYIFTNSVNSNIESQDDISVEDIPF